MCQIYRVYTGQLWIDTYASLVNLNVTDVALLFLKQSIPVEMIVGDTLVESVQTESIQVLFMRGINNSDTVGCNANLLFIVKSFHKKQAIVQIIVYAPKCMLTILGDDKR